jgi:hypothetical protein
MSNTAVLFNRMHQPKQQSSSSYYNTSTQHGKTDTTSNRHGSTSPSRRSIRRGAEMVRNHIQQQQQQQVMEKSETRHPTMSMSSYRSVPPPQQQQQQLEQFQQRGRNTYDTDDRIEDDDSGGEVTTEDHISVTSWSEYDCNVPSTNDDHRHRHSYTGSSVEMDPPSIADWSMEATDPIIDAHDATTNGKDLDYDEQPIDTTIDVDEEEEEDDDTEENSLVAKKDRNQVIARNEILRAKVPSPILNFNNQAMMLMTSTNESYRTSNTTAAATYQGKQSPSQKVPDTKGVDSRKGSGWISSDGDDDGDQPDNEDSTSDIVEITESMLLDPFCQFASAVIPSSPPKIDTKVLSASPTRPRTIHPTASNSSGSDDTNSDVRYLNRTHGITSSAPKNEESTNVYPLPFHLGASSSSLSPDTKKVNHMDNDVNNRPSFFMTYDVDAYCGYNRNDQKQDYENDQKYESPEKPVLEVPIHTPSTIISNLSTPGVVLRQHPQQRYHNKDSSTNYSHSHKSSTRAMLQYDQLLCDPAYLHAQSAGFIWQSIVGQHIRFPTTWWNGARGPPINGNTSTSIDISDESSLPWMYFGRHTVKNHEILNQLVKCRASAGRLLLHIVVQDLMTRAPIQDIVIGCFHPNSKGIRTPNTPALKRYENCRDIWMSVRKRSHTSVAATDSLLYSPSHWENDGSNHRNTTSAYTYAISRSPLGSGQRVTNHNVRAVFGDKAPLETIFLSEDELYERLAARIIQQQQQQNVVRNQTPQTTNANNFDLSPPMVILQELVFA